MTFLLRRLKSSRCRLPQRSLSTAGGGKDDPSTGKKAARERTNTGVFRSFTENIKQSSKDETLRADVRKFEEKLTELNENEAIKRAREVLSKAKGDAFKHNAAIISDVKEKTESVKKVVGETLSTAAKPIKGAAEIIKPYVPDISESEVVKKVGKSLDKAEQTLLENTNVYQYGGFKSREQREKSLKSIINDGPSATEEFVEEENPDAGSSVVPHKDSNWGKVWSDFVDNNRLVQKFFGAKRSYDESNNIFIYFAREITNSIGDRVASMFSENETAKAFREIQLRDPSFNLEKFMKLSREHIIPEILDAFISADLPGLRLWCSDAMFNMLKASFEAQLKPGFVSEGRILDLRGVELVAAKLLEDTPVVVFSFHTQQTTWTRAPDGKIVEGGQDVIDNVLYVMALAKEGKPPSNGVTQGWKLIELAIRDKNGGW